MTVRVVGGYVGHAPLGPGPFGDRYAGAGPDGPVGLTLLPAGYAANPLDTALLTERLGLSAQEIGLLFKQGVI